MDSSGRERKEGLSFLSDARLSVSELRLVLAREEDVWFP